MLAGEAHAQTNVHVFALILIVQFLQLIMHASVALTVFRTPWGVHGAAHIRDHF